MTCGCTPYENCERAAVLYREYLTAATALAREIARARWLKHREKALRKERVT